MGRSSADVTRLLREWHAGDKDAFAKLMPLVYGELRDLAQRYMRRQSPGHTLQTTALLHEAYLKLAAHWKTVGPLNALAQAHASEQNKPSTTITINAILAITAGSFRNVKRGLR